MILYFLTEGIAIKPENNLIINSKAEIIKHVSLICYLFRINICLFLGINLRTVSHTKQTERFVN